MLSAAMFPHSTRVCACLVFSFVYRKCVKVCVQGFSENDVCMDVCKQYMREVSYSMHFAPTISQAVTLVISGSLNHRHILCF